MAEVLRAELQLGIDQFQDALQQALGKVQAFAQALSGPLKGVSQAFQDQIQQMRAVTQATETSTRAQTALHRESAADSKAQYKAVSDFMLKDQRDREAAEKRTTANMTALQRAFVATTLGLAKEREAAERQVTATMTALQKNFLATTLGMAKEREAAEAQTVANMTALQKAFLTNTLGMAKEREAADKQAAAVRVAAEKQAAADLTAQYKATADFQKQQAKEAADAQKQAAQAAAQNQGSLLQKALGVAAGLGIATTLSSMISELKHLATESVQLAVKMQALTATFTALTGSSARASQELNFVRQVATKTGTDFFETARSFKSLEAAARGTGLEGTKIKDVFEGVSIASRVMGLSSAETGRALLALEQMVSKGKVSMEELRRQLGNALPGAMQIAARAMGVTSEELQRMVKEGLNAEDFVVRFGAQLKKEFGPGLADAAKTAAATFARLGNEVQAMGVNVGNAILKYLQPIASFVEKTLRQVREANERGNMRATAQMGGAPEGATEAQMARLIELQKSLDILSQAEGRISSGDIQRRTKAAQDEMAAIRATLQAKKELDAAFAKDVAPSPLGAVPFAAEVKTITEAVKGAKEELASLAQANKTFPSLVAGKEGELTAVRDQIREVEKAIAAVSATISGKKLKGAIPEEARAEIEGLKGIHAAMVQKEAAIEKAIDKEKEAAAERERLGKKAADDERKLSEDRTRMTAEAETEILRITEDRFAAERRELEIYMGRLNDATVSEETMARVKSAKLMEIAQREGQFKQELHDKEQRLKAEEATRAQRVEDLIRDIEAKGTSTRLDDVKAGLAKKMQAIEAATNDEEQLARASAAVQGAILEEEHKEAEVILKKEAKAWQDLAHDIESTLSSAFESILSGTFNLWDMIKRGFIKLLADLAAAALTQRIIIPLLVGALGAGGAAAGMGYGGVTGAGGAYGAGGGGGDMLGMGLGLAQNGASIYQGATGTSLLGSTGILGGVMGTSLGSIFGFGGATTASSFFGGGAGAVGAYGVGVDAGSIGAATPVAGSSSSIGTLAGTSVGTALGAVAVGIAAGQIFAKLNAMMGLHGTANTVLSGAGGGAIAGSMILPGIGTAVGAAVGAIGGLIAGLLTKTHKPKPLFDPISVEPGEVGYSETGGLELTREFNISQVKIRDLQYKTFADWEETFAQIEGGINDMAAQVVAGFQNVSPKFQAALVEPLNQAFADIAGQIAGLKIEGKDAADFAKNLEEMMSETIPGFFNDASKGIVAKLNAAIKKVEPVFEGFEDIIETLTQDLEVLHAQQIDMHTVLQGGIAQLQASTLDANGQLTAVQDAFTALIERFTAGNEAEQIALGPIIAKAANDLFAATLAHIRGIQQQNLVAMEQLNQTYTAIGMATYSPAQNEAYQRQQYDLVRNQLLQAGEAEQAGLAQQLAQLGAQLFSTVINYVRGIQQANLGAMGQLDQTYTALGTATYTPAQNEAWQRQQYDLLRNRLLQAGEAEQAALAQQLAQAGQQLFSTVMSYVRGLQQANLGAMEQLNQTHTALGGALLTPAQQEAYQRQQYDTLRNRLLQAGEAQQAALAGQLAEAGKQVFTTVMNYVRGLQQANLGAMEQLNQAHTTIGTALYTPAQQEAWQRQQYDLLRTRLLAAGEAEQAALAGQLAEAGKQVFSTVMSAVRAQQQANLAAMQTAKLTPQLEAGGSFESFNESYRTLQAELDTPARLYMRKREEYDALKTQFGSADAPTKVAMAPQLAQAGAELLRLAKSQEVLGQDVQLVRELQTSLMEDMTAAWTALGKSQQEWNATIVAQNEAEQARVDAHNAALLAANAQLEQTLVDLQTQLQDDMTIAHGLLAATNVTLEQRLGGLQAQLQQDMTVAHGLLATTNATLEGRLGGLQAQLQNDMTIAHNLLAATNATLEQRLVGLQAQLLQDLSIAHGLLAATNTTLELRLVGLQQSLVASLVAVDATIQGNFDRLQAAVQGQIDIATAQTVLLAASLSNLGGVDGVVAGSLEVLRQMQDRIGGASRSSDAVLQAQVVLLGGLSTIGAEQLQVLKDMNAKLGGGVRGFAEGSTYIPQNMLAFLHRGERVIPAGGGGTGTINQTITIRAEGDSVANQAYSAQLRDAIIGDIERQARLGRTNIMVKR